MKLLYSILMTLLQGKFETPNCCGKENVNRLINLFTQLNKDKIF